MRYPALFAVLLVLALAFVVPAMAEEGSKKPKEPGTSVEMPFLIAPMSANGELMGYAYISSKLIAASQPASIQIRGKLAFIQDAFVRDVNAAPVSKASDTTAVDKDALGKRLVEDARRVVGPAKVAGIVFTQIQFAPLHPKSTTDDAIPPSQRAPGPPAAPAPKQADPAAKKP
jgi:hypothetical protein